MPKQTWLNFSLLNLVPKIDFLSRFKHVRLYLHKTYARDLYNSLKKDNYLPWLDEEKILPGQDWDLEIEKAIKVADVRLILFSRQATERPGHIQKEIKLVLELAKEQPEGKISIIPVRLDQCELPSSLQRLYCVDLFNPDQNLFDPNGKEKGLKKLREAFDLCIQQRVR